MEYTREKAIAKLMAELEKVWKSGEEEGWLTAEDVRAHFAEKCINAEIQAAMLKAERISKDEKVKGDKNIDKLFAALKE